MVASTEDGFNRLLNGSNSSQDAFFIDEEPFLAWMAQNPEKHVHS